MHSKVHFANCNPTIELVERIEDHDVEAEAYEKCRSLFNTHPDLAGVYVTTEASIPVLNAARDAHMLDRLTVITTDLFPALVPEIRSRAVVRPIYQRPRTQGRMAFRVLHEFLMEGECSSFQVTLAPHLVDAGEPGFLPAKATAGIEHGERRQAALRVAGPHRPIFG